MSRQEKQVAAAVVVAAPQEEQEAEVQEVLEVQEAPGADRRSA